ncbi:PadR family transcriptional regulator [Mycobacterium sp. IS-1742]|uniref:PadR family transcriptional regulator n=1 Tax=Mycobacterium sp. IS-1742 TaxID=1772285 RepID=UPI00073FB3D8|nr:PadR family transcriptional regulator [Mycobacterium sp. IS-1742]KUI33242.1 PadR family transcriptional regulator [Mycobacterium sp. IS-1742]
MSNPFDFGFGVGPGVRRAMHEQRRQARREFRDQLREQRRGDGVSEHGADFDAGSAAGFGRHPGRGPGFEFAFDPRGGSFGFAAAGRGRRGGGRGRGRRGDVRTAIVALLAERPMHGYEMIQQIAERSNGLWKPSPGSVYPTLQLLVDEGLIVGTETEGSKKLFELTDEGRAAAEKVETPPWEQITDDAGPGHATLQHAVAQLMGAVAQSAYAAGEEQQARIVEIVNNARREIYGVLGEE